jgi:hypothetical protein
MLSYHILGTEHSRQRRDPRLKTKLQGIIGGNRIKLVAEEIDVNLADAQQKSVARDLAKAHTPEIPWVPMGMTFKQEEDAGIRNALDHAFKLQRKEINAYAKRANDFRENCWLNHIEQECEKQGISDGTVLIICGYNHRDFLAEKVRRLGIKEIDLDEYPDGLGKRLDKLVMTDL